MLENPTTDPATANHPIGARRILVVDDDMIVLQMVRIILERSGYVVMALADCDHLLDKIMQFQPGLIFMDHNLPDMSGLVATRLIKGHVLSKHIPIVYFTASEDILELAKKAGADDWLSKQCSARDIQNKADKFFSHNS